ncbi:hypothetical protein PIB30_005886 [Stylosanthes scabra]|uniref:Uncharacterized protein n=1 Tax=Stylosanthes scabra TaxID=79078 RepID=A0ABU6Q4Z9_9FABA|nr:hypothetical protein [Stylosanthes scabra]
MSKNNVLYILIIMIIGTFICYAVAESNHTVIHDDEKPWYPIADDAHDLEKCYEKCEQTYDKFLSKKSINRRRRCRHLCKKLNKCIEWCTESSADEEVFRLCIQEHCKLRFS